MKTIKQIADQLGVPKDRVKYQVRKLPGNLTEKAGNVTYITDDGMAYLQHLLVGKKDKNFTGELPDFSPLSEMIAALTKQLDEKDKLISQMQNNINTLTTALQAAQVLHAGTIQQKLVEPPPMGFMARLLSRPSRRVE